MEAGTFAKQLVAGGRSEHLRIVEQVGQLFLSKERIPRQIVGDGLLELRGGLLEVLNDLGSRRVEANRFVAHARGVLRLPKLEFGNRVFKPATH